MSVADVLSGSATHHLEAADCLAFLRSLPDDSADLVFGSPPYPKKGRRYKGTADNLKGQGWVDWMLAVYEEAQRACKGPVGFVVNSGTENRRWDASVLHLGSMLDRRGFHLHKPLVYFRYGVPGSGSKDWFRDDWEPILWTHRPGTLPWSDPLATAKPPKFRPGGRPSHRKANGDRTRGKDYRPPALANPGNVHQQSYGPAEVLALLCPDLPARPSYTASEVVALLAARGAGNVLALGAVGGGHLGHALAHAGEAPFPESLSDFAVLSLCPPNGVTVDPFLGTGTTLVSALRAGRRFLGCDSRESQIDLSRRRLQDQLGIKNISAPLSANRPAV